MPQYFDSKRNRLHLGDLLGSGGEGDVFVVVGLNNQVAKIYKKPIEKRKADKLTWMASHGSRDLFRFSAWVLDTIHTQSGDIVGFLMPRVGDHPIHQLYSPQSRKKNFPDATWPFLIRVAENLATCFQAVHSVKQVIGDINHANCFVKSNGTVALIDCDSFSIRANGRVYETEVLTSTYLPPELQCRIIKDVHRTQDHDNFGLAILVFQILFLGRHPFIGRPLNGLDSTLEEDIRAHRFAYGADSKSRGVEPPPKTLALDIASGPIVNLFRRAFLAVDTRPSASEWRESLQNLQKNLKRCLGNRAHHYYRELHTCPWCAMEAIIKKPIFELPTKQADGRGDVRILDLAAIERRIASNKFNSSSTLPLPNFSVSTIQDQARDHSDLIFNSTLIGIISGSLWLMFVGTKVFHPFVALLPASLISSIVSLALWSWHGKPKKEVQVALEELGRVGDELRDLKEQWKKATDSTLFFREKSRLQDLIQQYRKLDDDVRQRLQQLENNKRDSQLREYLGRFRIDTAVERGEIPKIGTSRLQALLSFGIETAADIESAAIFQVPGFGAVFTQNLMSWRTRKEQSFKFDSNKGVSSSEQQMIHDQSSLKRQHLDLEIMRGLQELERIVREQQTRIAELTREADGLRSKTETASALVSASGAQGFSLAPLIIVSVLIPLILFVGWFMFPQESVSGPVKSGGTGIVAEATPEAVATPEFFSDLDRCSRSTYSDDAEFCFNKGVEYSRIPKFQEAEQFFLGAVRLAPLPQYLHELGYVQYRLAAAGGDQGKFEESLANLKSSVEADGERLSRGESLGRDTFKLILKNYKAQSNFQEASTYFGNMYTEYEGVAELRALYDESINLLERSREMQVVW